MIRGLYTAASGMTTQQRKHDSITNNIANLNTTGYKQSDAISRSFPEMLISLINGGNGQAVRAIGSINTGVMVEEHVINFAQGDLRETLKPSDVALSSDSAGVYFTVWDENGVEKYTRNGRLVIGASGELYNTDGYRMLGQSGEPIILNKSMDQIVIDRQGRMFDALTGEPEQDGNGGQLTLHISFIDNPNALIREGNGVFHLTDAENNPAQIAAADNVEVMQGYVEGSNVDAMQSMVDMMAALRLYEANQKVIQYYDRSLDKAVNEIGRV